MKKENKFDNIYKAVTTGCTIFLMEIVLLTYIISNMSNFIIDTKIVMCSSMILIGFLPILVQILAYKCNKEDCSWTPISFGIMSILNILFAAFVIGLGQKIFILLAIAGIPLSVLLIFFSVIMVSLVEKGYNLIFKKTSMQLYALWCVLWIIIGAVII